ncbi:hypothetical protein Poli38472_001890 [Pythium oligandrum]|uniref:Protein kinase domain-containing protein n=1 Tax=Pythium oligandrum TaxID=41045 RepID=A0A8K1FQS6_PYTOL|nr:hypothetical protein Poli38472_001890 [Pythium oligandrum]|eukprot:TMW69734.1 hypothetical protein Poli38472_001890 [Pythium oligandrum]
MGLAMGDVDALMRAATDGDLEHVSKLLDGGCDLLSRDMDGQTALFYAASAGKVDVVRLLLARDQGRTLVKTAGNDGRTPLFAAWEKGYFHVIEELLSHDLDVAVIFPGGVNALHIVALTRASNLVEPLLRGGLAVDGMSYDGRTALHFASQFGHVDVVKQLLANGASVGLCDSYGQTALLLAAGEGKMDIVQVLLERDVDRTLVNLRRNTDGWTPLFAAGAGGHGDVFEKLLKHSGLAKEQLLQDASGPFGHAGVLKQLLAHGADPNISDMDGWTPLHWAARNGNIDVVSALTSSSVAGIRADPYAREKAFGCTPLHFAAEKGMVDVVKALLSNKVDPNVPDNGGATALHLAAYNDYPDVVKSLLECEVTVVDVKTSNREFIYTTTCADDDFERWEAKSKTALHLAAERGYTEVVNALLQYRANVNERDADSNTALHHVTKFSRLRDSDDNCCAIAMTLLEHGADEESRNQALCLASLRDGCDMVDLLLGLQVDVNATTCALGEDRTDWTALHCASSQGNVEVVKRLLAVKTVKLNARDKTGKTPLHVACQKKDSKDDWAALNPASYSGRLDVVRELLALAVDVNALDEDEHTALHLASRWGFLDLVRALLGQRVDLDASDKDGWTALHHASFRGHTDVVRELLARGMNPAARSRDGATPLTVCFLEMPLSSPFVHKNSLNYGSIIEEAVFLRVLETSRALMSFGALHDGPLEKFPLFGDEHRALAAIISICLRHWTQEQQRKKPSLTALPLEVFKRGSKAVETYLTEIAASDEKDLVWRRKVCVVGSSKAGKTSLVKSIDSMTPTMEKDDDRTIGVDLFRLEFKEDVKSGSTTHQRSHTVTFWDFAGQDEYHVAHTLFFSRRTLYLLCVDVEEFDEVVRKSHACEDEDEAESLVLAFVQARVWRWIRLIFARQPDAEFVLFATKTDALVGDTQSRLKDLESELLSIVAELKQTYKEEIQREIDALPDSPTNDQGESPNDERIRSLQSLLVQLETSVPTSWICLNIRESSSLQLARTSIEDVVRQSGQSFAMPDKYARVLEKVEELRQKARDANMKNRIRQSFRSLPDIIKTLMADIHDLTEDEAMTILETLHDLGDVLWYARDGHHMLGDTIILDAELLIDFIRQIVCHDPTMTPGVNNSGAGDNALLIQAMKQHGTVSNKLLRHSFSLWKRLAYPNQLLQFKGLLEHFNLAYPGDGDVMQADSDVVVPSYWRFRGNQIDLTGLAPLSIGDIDSSHINHFVWEYYLGDNSAELVDTVFEQLAVRSYHVFPNRMIHGRCVESAQKGRLAIRTACGMVGSRGPVIHVEVLGKADHDPSGWLRDVHKALEDVLKMFPGILVAREAVAGRHTCNLDKCIPKWRGLPENQREAKLREHSWLPNGVVEWFRRTDGGVRDWFIPPESIVKHKGPAFAAGAFGAVYLAKWQHTDVVVKEMLVSEMRRFLKEVTHWYGLRHDNVVRFIGANDKKEPYFIVSSYAAGGELLSFLSSEKENGRDVVWRKLKEAAAGLSHIHRRGIVHGDLKGSNILVGKDGTAMIADFGLSFSESGSSSVVTEKKNTLRAMAWRAPEFARLTEERPTRKSDVFSLGMCIVEAVRGGNPWCRKSTTCPREECKCWSNEEIRECLRNGQVKVYKPEVMTEAQWELVKKMIALSSSDRPELSEVISKLADFAEEEKRVALEKENPY